MNTKSDNFVELASAVQVAIDEIENLGKRFDGLRDAAKIAKIKSLLDTAYDIAADAAREKKRT